MTYQELAAKFRKHNSTPAGREHPVIAHIIFTEDSFTQYYSTESRTYKVSSYNKAYLPNMCGYSVFGSCLDGTDPNVRLDWYMRDEKGGADGWKVQNCFIVEGTL